MCHFRHYEIGFHKKNQGEIFLQNHLLVGIHCTRVLKPLTIPAYRTYGPRRGCPATNADPRCCAMIFSRSMTSPSIFYFFPNSSSARISSNGIRSFRFPPIAFASTSIGVLPPFLCVVFLSHIVTSHLILF